MKRIGYIILFLTTICFAVNAQPGKRMERIRAIKIAYITDKLQLSTEQSEKFWPVYHRFEDDRAVIVKKYRKDKGLNDPSADESMRSIDDDIEMQERVVGLRKKYKEEFLKVISPKQLAALVEAEREFKKLLLQQLKERRENRGERPLR